MKEKESSFDTTTSINSVMKVSPDQMLSFNNIENDLASNNDEKESGSESGLKVAALDEYMPDLKSVVPILLTAEEKVSVRMKMADLGPKYDKLVLICDSLEVESDLMIQLKLIKQMLSIQYEGLNSGIYYISPNVLDQVRDVIDKLLASCKVNSTSAESDILHERVSTKKAFNLTEKEKKIVKQKMEIVRNFFNKLELIESLLVKFGGPNDAENLKWLQKATHILNLQYDGLEKDIYYLRPETINKVIANLTKLCRHVEVMVKKHKMKVQWTPGWLKLQVVVSKNEGREMDDDVEIPYVKECFLEALFE
ncbi:hypothetical protein HDU76_005072 [Blyttiomyces sp. JEL0837]|nr:hypothetical protein HDU76_005072 [Blyttiomyces sp. JEL0837]